MYIWAIPSTSFLLPVVAVCSLVCSILAHVHKTSREKQWFKSTKQMWLQIKKSLNTEVQHSSLNMKHSRQLPIFPLVVSSMTRRRLTAWKTLPGESQNIKSYVCKWCLRVLASAVSPQDFLETLEDLDLSYNNLVDIPWETIAQLVSVNTLSLDHNLIESVPEGIFSNLHKLARSGLASRTRVSSCHLNMCNLQTHWSFIHNIHSKLSKKHKVRAKLKAPTLNFLLSVLPEHSDKIWWGCLIQ